MPLGPWQRKYLYALLFHNEFLSINYYCNTDEHSLSVITSLCLPRGHISPFLSLSTSLHSLSTTKVDYMDPIPGQLRFSSIASTRQCFTVAITDDNIFERLETFSVGLSSSDPNLTLVGPGGVVTALVDIIDNDGKLKSNTGCTL